MRMHFAIVIHAHAWHNLDMNNATSNAQEKADFYAPTHCCVNCKTTRGFLNSIWLNDSEKPVLLCEDCAEEAHRIEQEAEALTAMPSCEARQRIIDEAASTGELVNRLRAHDLAQCVACAAGRKSVVTAIAAAYLSEVA